MLYKIKKNIFFILSFTILLSILCFNTMNFIQNQKKLDIRKEESIKFCLSNDYEEKEYQNFCEDILNKPEIPLDFYTIFTEIVIFGYRKINLFLFLFLLIPGLMYICNYLKHKQIKNDSTRQEYKKTIKKLLKESYKAVLIIPIIIFIAFFICFIYTKSLDSVYSITYNTTGWNDYTLTHPYLFLSLYLSNIFIHSFLYINIGMIIARKQHNYLVALILSFLTIIGIEAFLEIGINGIFFISILKSEVGMIFNIINMLAFNDVFGIGTSTIVPFIMMIFSFIVLYFSYKSKENLISDCEKNDE